MEALEKERVRVTSALSAALRGMPGRLLGEESICFEFSFGVSRWQAKFEPLKDAAEIVARMQAQVGFGIARCLRLIGFADNCFVRVGVNVEPHRAELPRPRAGLRVRNAARRCT